MKLVTKYQISAINSCWEKCAYMFNVYKNQLSRQTGSRNLTGPKMLPTIWYTYMTLVTKYQISAINNYWEKCDKKYLGQTEGWTEVKQYTPSPFGERGYNYKTQQIVICISNRVNTMIWFEDALICSRGWAVPAFWLNLVSIHPIVLKKIFKDFQLFNQSEDMAAIFNIRQGQQTHFWKRSIQRVSHQSLVQFDLVVLEKIKIRKVNGWQMTRHKVMGKAHLNRRPWWTKNFFENYQMDTPTIFEHNWSCGFREEINM
jgi:hypothetical protein